MKYEMPTIRKLNANKWKYKLIEDYSFYLPYNDFKNIPLITHTYFDIQTVCTNNWKGIRYKLTIKRGYRWDGATGLPDITQTKSLILPSLIHDVFCQMTNEKIIPWKPWRSKGDSLFQSLCRECGVPGWRKWYLITAVKLNSFIRGWSK